MNQKPLAEQRPSQRVRSYILDPKHGIAGKEGRLPTMRELAAQLNVSLATVQNVYRTLKEEGCIVTRVGDGAYLSAAMLRNLKGGEHRLFFNRLPQMTERPGSLQGGYYGALLHALVHGKYRFDFSILDGLSDSGEEARTLFQNGELDAMLIFPFLPCQPLVDTCDREKIPYVTIHPANASTNANFVTPDYFDAGFRIGKAATIAGRRRIALLTYGQTVASSTGFAIVSGLGNGLFEETDPISLERMTMRFGPEYMEELEQWLKARRRSLPELIICHRPNSYPRVLEALSKMKVSVPEEVSVISISHSTNDAQAAITGVTRLAVPCEEVCRAGLDMLVRRIETGGEPLPGIRLPLTFAGGATTSMEINRQLGLIEL